MCVSTVQSFALSIVPCCTGQCRVYLRHMHIVPHCTPCTYCTHGIHCCHTITRHLVSLTIFWQKVNEYSDVAHLTKTYCKFYKTGHCCTSSVYKGCTMLWSAALQHISLSGSCIAFQPCTPYAICVVFNSFPAHHCVVHILACVPIHPHSGTEKRRGGALCR